LSRPENSKGENIFFSLISVCDQYYVVLGYILIARRRRGDFG
jgi:hypothetical protein